jgi:hypothetical protein
MCARAAGDGTPTSISRSNRPGRRTAKSTLSTRFVAAMTTSLLHPRSSTLTNPIVVEHFGDFKFGVTFEQQFAKPSHQVTRCNYEIDPPENGHHSALN